MKNILLGLILGLLIVPATVFFYFKLGFAPVATSDPMFPFERYFARTGLHARMDKEIPKDVPLKPDEATFESGAKIYMGHCAVCHGSVDGSATAIAKGMFPPPPQLLKPDHMVTDDEPGETFWKVKNGIRLTGMPGFHASLSDDEMWQVSLMLANADKLSDAVKQSLSFKPPPAPAATNPAAPVKK